MRKLSAGAWALVGSCFVCTVLFFVTFFTLIYPEIRVNTVYKFAVCRVVSDSIEPYKCCTKSCYGCASCSYGDPSCSYAMQNGLAGTCCNGYECCTRCCSTCHSCSGSGKSKHCHSYSCNCRCCSFTANQACSVSCDTCYNAYVSVEYHTQGGSPQAATVEDECGTSKSCATGFVGQYTRNTTWGCWYDPDNYSTVVFHRGYTVWKWFPFAVPALSILAVMVIVSDRLCARAGKQMCGPRLPTYVGRLTTVLLWAGCLLPFAFFLPLYEFGDLPSPTGREVLLGFIFAFPAAACVASVGYASVRECGQCTAQRRSTRPSRGNGYTPLADPVAATLAVPPVTTPSPYKVADGAPGQPTAPPSPATAVGHDGKRPWGLYDSYPSLPAERDDTAPAGRTHTWQDGYYKGAYDDRGY